MIGVDIKAIDFQLIGAGLAENREKQQLESTDWALLDWNHKSKAKIT